METDEFEDVLADELWTQIISVLRHKYIKEFSNINKNFRILCLPFLYKNLSNHEIPLRILEKYGSMVKIIRENDLDDLKFDYRVIGYMCKRIKYITIGGIEFKDLKVAINNHNNGITYNSFLEYIFANRTIKLKYLFINREDYCTDYDILRGLSIKIIILRDPTPKTIYTLDYIKGVKNILIVDRTSNTGPFSGVHYLFKIKPRDLSHLQICLDSHDLCKFINLETFFRCNVSKINFSRTPLFSLKYISIGIANSKQMTMIHLTFPNIESIYCSIFTHPNIELLKNKIIRLKSLKFERFEGNLCYGIYPLLKTLSIERYIEHEILGQFDVDILHFNYSFIIPDRKLNTRRICIMRCTGMHSLLFQPKDLEKFPLLRSVFFDFRSHSDFSIYYKINEHFNKTIYPKEFDINAYILENYLDDIELLMKDQIEFDLFVKYLSVIIQFPDIDFFICIY